MKGLPAHNFGNGGGSKRDMGSRGESSGGSERLKRRERICLGGPLDAVGKELDGSNIDEGQEVGKGKD